MAEKDGKRSWVMVSRAAVIAEALGFEGDEALTLGRAVSGLTPIPKGFPWGCSSRHPKRSKNSARKCGKKKR